MFPVIGRSFCRGNFEGLVNLFFWESVCHQSIGVHYNFVQPGWPFVPYLGASLGLSGNDIYVERNQSLIGGPFEFVLQANIGGRYFINRNWGFLVEGDRNMCPMRVFIGATSV